ncbi:PilN domain-containing protein [Catenovulum maritimum]|uniref:MSHA biogenesis protein MshI n=1 Tax=Catenovulum maritimum TaxID=1513271 RepID=A0A0J8GZ93_9ALTE|nr:PilN domain-containing protein [Catenovulum maritimum]KMT66038.1 hypothetical protein XM47_06205 [Catenovulum maritimum]
MKRNINFYLDEFKPKPDPLSLTKVLVAWTVSILLVAIFSFWVKQEAKQVDAEHKQLKQSVNSKEIMIQEFNSAIQTRKQDPKLIENIEILKRKLALEQKIMFEVNRRTKGEKFGYSKLMFDLSHKRLAGVWLNKISFNQDDIKLNGASNQVYKIPKWLKQLSSSNYFNGRSFKNLELKASDNGLYTEFSVTSQFETNKMSQQTKLALPKLGGNSE